METASMTPPLLNSGQIVINNTWEDTNSLHCKYPGEPHTIPYTFSIRNCMGLSGILTVQAICVFSCLSNSFLWFSCSSCSFISNFAVSQSTYEEWNQKIILFSLNNSIKLCHVKHFAMSTQRPQTMAYPPRRKTLINQHAIPSELTIIVNYWFALN